MDYRYGCFYRRMQISTTQITEISILVFLLLNIRNKINMISTDLNN